MVLMADRTEQEAREYQAGIPVFKKKISFRYDHIADIMFIDTMDTTHNTIINDSDFDDRVHIKITEQERIPIGFMIVPWSKFRKDVIRFILRCLWPW